MIGPIEYANCTRCGHLARGKVGQIGQVPAHTCKQCAAHCEIAKYIALTSRPLQAS